MRIRSHPFPDAAALPYWMWDDDQPLKAHPAYRKAKAGEQEAAIDLVWDLTIEFLAGLQAKLPLELTYVAPYAREATGDNAIPLMLASACAEILHGDVETEIVQASRVFHTGAKAMERLLLRPQFDGPVTPGTAYVLVDDVTCLGGTLAELADYVQAGGGQVAAVITLVNAGRLKPLKPEPLVTRRLRERCPDAIQHIFGIDPGALTANEACYLSGFRTADELRNRAAKAAEEIDLRLRAKGFQLEAQPAPLSQEGIS
ncbi:MAG: conjugal transfer protein TraN [Cyanobium sp.]|nr:MAG: conjugal transfer protein TraN [Cyanobium sp.]